MARTSQAIDRPPTAPSTTNTGMLNRKPAAAIGQQTTAPSITDITGATVIADACAVVTGAFTMQPAKAPTASGTLHRPNANSHSGSAIAGASTRNAPPNNTPSNTHQGQAGGLARQTRGCIGVGGACDAKPGSRSTKHRPPLLPAGAVGTSALKPFLSLIGASLGLHVATRSEVHFRAESSARTFIACAVLRNTKPSAIHMPKASRSALAASAWAWRASAMARLMVIMAWMTPR